MSTGGNITKCCWIKPPEPTALPRRSISPVSYTHLDVYKRQMERQEKVVLTLDSYEHGIMIRALNELRNDMLEEQRDPGPVEDVLLKTIDAPAQKDKKAKRRDEAR